MRPLLIVLPCLLGALPAQQSVVVPAAHATTDAPSRFWIGGVSSPVRQLTLIDASHLQSILGREITSLSFRRDATAEVFAGGRATLVVKLSTADRTAATASPQMGANVGPDEILVFSGTITLPSSPAAAGPNVGWTPDNMVRVSCSPPFRYSGGTLCLDISGVPDAQQPVAWWPADAVWDGTPGTVASIGDGCGPYGGATGQWAGLSENDLVAGGTALFHAWGTPGNLGYLLLAQRAVADAVDLSVYGATGCHAHLAAPLGGAIAPFGSSVHPSAPALGGFGSVTIQLPNQPWIVGASFGGQWFDLGPGTFYSSNALQWSVSGNSPSVGMTLVSAHFDNGQPPTQGRVFPGRGHVVRFDYR